MAAEGDWDEGAGEVSSADIVDAYVDRLMVGYAGGAYRIGWDTGNGAARPVIEKLVKLLPGEHPTISTTADGNFPIHHTHHPEDKKLTNLTRLTPHNTLPFDLPFDRARPPI